MSSKSNICEICGANFTQSKNLQRHVRVVHEKVRSQNFIKGLSILLNFSNCRLKISYVQSVAKDLQIVISSNITS